MTGGFKEGSSLIGQWIERTKQQTNFPPTIPHLKIHIK